MNKDIYLNPDTFKKTNVNLKGITTNVDINKHEEITVSKTDNVAAWNSSDFDDTKTNDFKALSAFTAMYGGIGYKVVNADDINISTYKFGNDKIRNYNDKYEDQKNYLDYSFTGYDCTKVYPEYLAYLDANK